MRRSPWIGLLALSLAACSDEGGGDGCEMDAERACECSAGQAGVQVCEFSRWGACRCDPDAADGGVCQPGEELSCTCDGRFQGVRRCLPGGDGWSACDCAGAELQGEGEGEAAGCGALVPVGAACEADSECGVGGTCIHDLDQIRFPQGYCTLDPAVAGCCPERSVEVSIARIVGDNNIAGGTNDGCVEGDACLTAELLTGDCTNGHDDDGDNLVDCEDSDCTGVHVCYGPGGEDNPEACSNGEDEDQDGRIDCSDPDCVDNGCAQLVEDCASGRDDDGNGQIDCEDLACLDAEVCLDVLPGGDVEGKGESMCIADCVLAEDCGRGGRLYICGFGLCLPSPEGFAGPPPGAGLSEANDAWCQDGRDNDADELIDCADPECARTSPCDELPDENTDEACSDTLDNDRDGQADCTDRDCRRLPLCRGDEAPPEGSPEDCVDGEDNDGDEQIDCDDYSCRFVAACAGFGETGVQCEDDLDNDRDRRHDCDDPDCLGSEACPAGVEHCNNTLDDDGDGLVDCDDDIDCSGVGGCPLFLQENDGDSCDNGVDDDQDGLADCLDPGCWPVLGCTPPPEGEESLPTCVARIDGDGDGLGGCDDPDCQPPAICGPCGQCEGVENTNDLSCDRHDNDNDGVMDCEDPDCAAVPACFQNWCEPPDRGEGNLGWPNCQDEVDNDGDGRIDCEDLECQIEDVCFRGIGEGGVEGTCQDGVDDDGDGAADCADPECLPDEACREGVRPDVLGPLDGVYLDATGGADHTCVVVHPGEGGDPAAGGEVVCRGSDAYEQSTPPAGEFLEVRAGSFNTCGLRPDRSIECWGAHFDGQSDVDPDLRFESFAMGWHHGCGMLLDEAEGAELRCWGKDDMGQATPPDDGVRYRAVTAGNSHTCAMLLDGWVSCWGADDAGQASPPAGAFRSITAGGMHTCGIREEGGAVVCWGSNHYEDGFAGQATPPPDTSMSLLSGGALHTCGLTAGDGFVVCWGLDSFDRLDAPAEALTALHPGHDHTCALAADGGLTCWGRNDHGQAP